MSLPDAWVDQLFAKLTVRYGASFLRQYAGLDVDEVKADWAQVLGPFSQSKDALRHGLEHLPSDKPPNALQFRDLCRRPVEHDTKALKLPAPPADPVMAAKVRQAFKRVGASGDVRSGWERLRDRELAGENLSEFQRKAWRDAIGVSTQEQQA
jgi:hypothetical protein